MTEDCHSPRLIGGPADGATIHVQPMPAMIAAMRAPGSAAFHMYASDDPANPRPTRLRYRPPAASGFDWLHQSLHADQLRDLFTDPRID